ncbi:MAG: YchJ family protein [Coxiellaceae bacterium]|nr:YchJ family protein [Coxiellaceae bacterium]
MQCPCGSNKAYNACCQPYINGDASAPTVEALMRSRYSAYSQANTDYIQQTMQGKAAAGYDPLSSQQWAQSIEWLGLQVFDHTAQGNEASVTFAARYRDANGTQFIHEKSSFRRIDEAWYYTDGKQQSLPQRNQPCLCGSGKKFKRCCGGR